jgi:hypothetical protein
MKLTVPDGAVVALALTVAVRSSAWPAVTGFGDATRVMVVVAVEAVTVTEAAGDVLATKLALPRYWAVRL